MDKYEIIILLLAKCACRWKVNALLCTLPNFEVDEWKPRRNHANTIHCTFVNFTRKITPSISIFLALTYNTRSKAKGGTSFLRTWDQDQVPLFSTDPSKSQHGDYNGLGGVSGAVFFRPLFFLLLLLLFKPLVLFLFGASGVDDGAASAHVRVAAVGDEPARGPHRRTRLRGELLRVGGGHHRAAGFFFRGRCFHCEAYFPAGTPPTVQV